MTTLKQKSKNQMNSTQNSDQSDIFNQIAQITGAEITPVDKAEPLDLVWKNQFMCESKEEIDFMEENFMKLVNEAGYTEKQATKVTIDVVKNRRKKKDTKSIDSINSKILKYNSMGLETDEQGRPRQHAGNYKALLKYLQCNFRFNQLSENIELNGKPLTNNDICIISNKMSDEAGLESPLKIFNAITDLAIENAYHPIKDYLEKQVWDGKPRVEQMFSTYFSCEDNKLYREYAKLFMVAAVKRIYQHGCKFDNMLVLQGEQGNGKSTFFQKLSVDSRWYNDNIQINPNKDSLIYLQDAWIVIFDEMDSWNKADTNTAKAFITRRSDKYRAPYDRMSEEHQRHCVFVGNTNRDTFLKDNTAIAERRYWIVKTNGDWKTNAELLKKMTPEVVDQLWAEAKHIYDQDPYIELMLPAELYQDMVNDQSRYKVDNDNEIYEYIEDALNQKYSDSIYNDMEQLYKEFEGNVSMGNCEVSQRDYFSMMSVNNLILMKRWGYYRGILKHFCQWTHSPQWSGDIWEHNVCKKIDGHAVKCIVRTKKEDSSDAEEKPSVNNIITDDKDSEINHLFN